MRGCIAISLFVLGQLCCVDIFFVHVDFFELVIFALELRNEKNVGAKYIHTHPAYTMHLYKHTSASTVESIEEFPIRLICVICVCVFILLALPFFSMSPL